MKTILMVEDESMLSELFEEFVKMIPDVKYLGCCDEGSKAIDTCVELKPDLVILDIRLPGINGLQMLTHLKETIPATRVIIFSGSLDSHTVKMAVESGAAGFVEKSYGLSELNRGIIQVLNGGDAYFSVGARKLARQFVKSDE